MRFLRKECVALLCCFLTVIGGIAPVRFAAAADPAPVAAAPAAPEDSGWPRTYEKDGNQALLYQPQIDNWDFANISFRMAIAITAKGDEAPSFGVISVKAATTVDNDSRTVLITDMDTTVRFPNADPKQSDDLEKMARELLPRKQFLVVSLDRMLACMDNGPVQVSEVKLNLDPPPIYYSTSPAVMVIFMGQPQFEPIAGTRLMFATNTNWDVLLDQDSSRYYLLNGDSWLSTPDPVKGPWTAVSTLPASFNKLPADDNWNEVRAQIPARRAKVVTKIIVSTTPAELIVTDGGPLYSPIAGTRLLYVSNPEMPLFRNSADNNFYYLVAGRWFRAKSLDGPWSAASADLPDEFAKIPDDSPMSYVLSSVPNTPDAKDAILLASVPTLANVDVNTATVDVSYDGPPSLVPIEGTPMQYVVNTPYSVIYASNRYYCCYQGVWFVSSVSAGPWVVCSAVPTVIYTIPPACPLYNVTYVRVYSATPTVVVVGYTGGYSGAYVAATGALMFGAGILIGAAIVNNNRHSYHYHSAYFSYGCGASYRWSSGGFYPRPTLYGPYGGAGRIAAYNPRTGGYVRASYSYGPGGSAYRGAAYNPNTNVFRARSGGSNGYQSWDRGVVANGKGDWARGGSVSNPRGSAGWVQTSSGAAAIGKSGPNGSAGIVKTAGGDVYAGRDGNVYRRDGGQWQSNQGSQWKPADKSNPQWSGSGTQQRLNSDSQSRVRGDQLQARTAGQSNAAAGARAGGGARGGGGNGGAGRGSK
jgi:hypothetical protein